jgi:hypothetical protein
MESYLCQCPEALTLVSRVGTNAQTAPPIGDAGAFTCDITLPPAQIYELFQIYET